MGNVWLTSDLHLNHQNILKYEPNSRPFKTIAEMNDKIIENYNERVKFGDMVYVLGDFILGAADEVGELVSRLQHGSLCLIPGNHDSPTKIRTYKEIGINVLPQLYDLTYQNTKFVLCHYPMATWKGREHGAIQAFGHVHSMEDSHRIEGNMPYLWNQIHIGVDDNNLRPWLIEEAIDNCKLRANKKGE